MSSNTGNDGPAVQPLLFCVFNLLKPYLGSAKRFHRRPEFLSSVQRILADQLQDCIHRLHRDFRKAAVKDSDPVSCSGFGRIQFRPRHHHVFGEDRVEVIPSAAPRRRCAYTRLHV